MSPYPSTLIPILPTTGNYCLWQIHKEFKGQRVPKLNLPYHCDPKLPFQTQRGTLKLSLELKSAGNPCDQRPNVIPNGSRLLAFGVVIRRMDGLADFNSVVPQRFVIVDPKGVILFKGYIELMDRVGSHHPPFGQEPCNLEEHIEGWLVGLGGDTLKDVCLRAMIVAKGSLNPSGPSEIAYGTLIGVLVVPALA